MILQTALLLFFLIITVRSVRDDLMDAVTVANVEVVKRLLDQDPSVMNSRSPVLVNRREKEHGRISVMVCGFDPQSTNRSLVDNDCLTIVRMLHERGANISHVDNYGWDSLSIAASRGYKKVCKYLIGKNVTLNRLDKEGRTAILKSAAHGFSDTFEVLYEAKGNPNIIDNSGLTALHYATNLAMNNQSYLPSLNYITNIIKKNTIDNYLDKDNRTCLMYSLINNNVEVTKLLLSVGADPRLSDKYGVKASTMCSDPFLINLVSKRIVELTEKDHLKWLKTHKYKPEF